MSAKRDYYEVLEVSREASVTEIKRAYRKKAMQFHPDRNPGDDEAEERFKECAEAFEVLSDDQKRQLYDQFGHEGPRNAGFQGFNGADEIFAHFGDLFGDLFGNLGFGGARGRRGGPQRGADLKMVVEIPFMEAVEGSERELSVPKRVDCEVCDGTGAEPGTSPTTCPECNGRGQVVHSQGFFRVQTTCPRCRGRGQIIEHPCKACSGSGTVQKETTLTVRIPPGIDHGQTLRVPGGGQPGVLGGPPGNLYVVISVEADPRFEREEYDIFSEVEISMFQAALGTKVTIDTLDGETEIDIDAGTQPETVITRRGEGIPVLGGRGKGDHHVRVKVSVPKKLSSEQHDKLKALAEELGFSVADKKKGLLGSLFG
ncbi:molecular chaperone DnaJ [Pseudenhygromyxa sp. WMMC2535]|uniref:molecular chaperone DnaJ n=1 Tax=Pseudenhygromyxa sp. WMMC2535 TaxID=2712867 RepID=UPI001554F08E|nr:molecular chaperone DnaJ [Pseudenhygromyxa sp. WMMC2535]